MPAVQSLPTCTTASSPAHCYPASSRRVVVRGHLSQLPVYTAVFGKVSAGSRCAVSACCSLSSRWCPVQAGWLHQPALAAMFVALRLAALLAKKLSTSINALGHVCRSLRLRAQIRLVKCPALRKSRSAQRSTGCTWLAWWRTSTPWIRLGRAMYLLRSLSPGTASSISSRKTLQRVSASFKRIPMLTSGLSAVFSACLPKHSAVTCNDRLTSQNETRSRGSQSVFRPPSPAGTGRGFFPRPGQLPGGLPFPSGGGPLLPAYSGQSPSFGPAGGGRRPGGRGPPASASASTYGWAGHGGWGSHPLVLRTSQLVGHPCQYSASKLIRIFPSGALHSP